MVEVQLRIAEYPIVRLVTKLCTKSHCTELPACRSDDLQNFLCKDSSRIVLREGQPWKEMCIHRHVELISRVRTAYRRARSHGDHPRHVVASHRRHACLTRSAATAMSYIGNPTTLPRSRLPRPARLTLTYRTCRAGSSRGSTRASWMASK